MFKHLNTLKELNAARVQEASKPDADIIQINNAYNEARQRIISNKKPFKTLTTSTVSAREVSLKRSIPIEGYSNVVGTIILGAKGFLV